MIVFEQRMDIFESEMQTLVCPVNTVGVMGKGLALQFKDKYPDLLVAYRRACLSDVFLRDGFYLHPLKNGQQVLCMPTKRDWQNPSQLLWIEKALIAVANTYQQNNIQSLAIPAIGCGEGRLDWRDVRSCIYWYFEHSNLPVGICLSP